MNPRVMPSVLSSFLELRGDERHIVDQLIAERATRLSRHPLWPLMRPVIYGTFHYRHAVSMANDMAEMTGWEALDHLSRLLSLDITVRGLENLPASGAFILAPSHPTGIADGVAVFDVLKRIRPDMAIFANRDALRVTPRFRDVLIPVEWREGEKTRAKSRDTLEMTAGAFRDGKCIVLFPAGRIAHWHDGHLTERPWQNSLVALARRYDVPIVPARLTSRNSGLFYLMSRWSSELRDMTVFRELLNKSGKPFSVTIGRPIDPALLAGEPEMLTPMLQRHTVEALAADPDAEFSPRPDAFRNGL